MKTGRLHIVCTYRDNGDAAPRPGITKCCFHLNYTAQCHRYALARFPHGPAVHVRSQRRGAAAAAAARNAIFPGVAGANTRRPESLSRSRSTEAQSIHSYTHHQPLSTKSSFHRLPTHSPTLVERVPLQTGPDRQPPQPPDPRYTFRSLVSLLRRLRRNPPRASPLVRSHTSSYDTVPIAARTTSTLFNYTKRCPPGSGTQEGRTGWESWKTILSRMRRCTILLCRALAEWGAMI